MTFVVKATGQKEEFSEEKLRSSIQRAGIPENLHQEVVDHVKQKLHDGITTAEIYQHILEFLDTTHPHSKSKYSLKQSIMQLGPTGYPFEKFLAHLLEKEGYTTQTNQLLRGNCVVHEVDVVAKKDNQTIMIEAKFHNTNQNKTDLHVSLYTKARFDDVAQKNGLTHAMLITNTNATVDAVAYAECCGMDIITWAYPQGRGLRDLIEKHSLHPITTLQSLSQSQKQQLMENNLVLCRDVLTNKDNLSLLNLSEEKVKEIIDEASFVCPLPPA